MPDNLKIEDIQKCQVYILELVELFFQNLIGGPDSRSWTSNLNQIRTKSISEGVAFAATGGRKEPQNHIMLGIAFKSLTGSRKVVKIMNYELHAIQEIETEATF